MLKHVGDKCVYACMHVCKDKHVKEVYVKQQVENIQCASSHQVNPDTDSKHMADAYRGADRCHGAWGRARGLQGPPAP